MLEVIETLRPHPRSSGVVTAVIDSLLVRTNWPSRSEIRGSAPSLLHCARRWLVPSAPAATTTPRAVCVRRSLRIQEPVRSLVTAYPSEPSAAPSGRIDVTVRSGSICTPRRSANHR